MKIAITAASGNLGSAIISELKKSFPKENIRAIARSTDKVIHTDIEICEGDYSVKAHFSKALKDTDVMLLISSMAPPEERKQHYRNVIEAAVENGVKKIVYTSITGPETETAFSPIVQSNRYAEKLIKESNLNWVIGRNGLYIDPDLDYLETYTAEGEIKNCAGEGKCPYTSRKELAVAYVKLLTEEKHNGSIYNLVGEPVTQQQLVDEINKIYNLDLSYRQNDVDSFMNERREALGDLLGTIVGGIYEAIQKGEFDVASDYHKAAGRPHKSLREMIMEHKS